MNAADMPLQKKTVASKSAEVEVMESEWHMLSALMGGTGAMRAAGAKYLPKWPQETAATHTMRVATATLLPAFPRTVETLASKPFSKPITLPEGMDPEVEEWMSNVDLQGATLDTFSVELMKNALSHGLGGIFVEYQQVDPAVVRTKADEKALGLRPYMIHIRPGQVLGWKTGKNAGGELMLTQLRFMEYVKEAEDDFHDATIEQVRVLTPGAWATYRKKMDPETQGQLKWVLIESGTTSLNVIPFVPVYGRQLGLMVARPPLLELAYLNVKHWQSQSDQDTILHVARVPILTRTGMADKYDANGVKVPNDLIIGSSVAVDLPLNATLAYVEHTGSAIDAGQKSLDSLKDDMRQAGAELLVLSKGPVTATEVATDNSVSMCDLQRITQGLEASLDKAIALMCQYASKPEPKEIELFDDFGAATLAEASGQLLLSMATAGKLSDETLFEEVQRRGIVSSDVAWDDERARIEAQGPPPGSEGIDPLTGKPIPPPKPAKPAKKPGGA